MNRSALLLPLPLTFLLLAPAGLTGCARPRASGPWLETARDALRWVEAQAFPDRSGTFFPDVPGEEGTPTSNPDLYHGQAGRALGLLQMAAATGDDHWRKSAGRALVGLETAVVTAQEGGRRDAGLYTGLAGAGSVWLAAGRVLGEIHWTEQARAAGDTLLAWSRPAGSGREWEGTCDIISGAAGSGLFLLELYNATGEPRYLEGAERAARRLAETGERDPAGEGRWWPIAPGAPTHYPNFAHGTAGVAFFLRRVAARTTNGELRTTLLEAVSGAVRWLRAHGTADGCVVFHHQPGGEELQYAGWCHGPVGTGRLFLEEALDGLPADGEVLEAAGAGAAWLRELGPEPGESPSGYWGNVSVCCGTAGMLDGSLDLFLATGDPACLEQARGYARVLVERAVRTGEGLCWPQAEHRVRPELIQAQTGYMQGAAGIAAALLRLYLVEQGRPEGIVRLPDEVMPAIAR
jgi:lantibiotic modifying enzyme